MRVWEEEKKDKKRGRSILLVRERGGKKVCAVLNESLENS